MATTTTTFRDASPLLQDPDALRRRAQEDGYLFFKQLLPKDLVLELRRQFLTILDSYGWLRSDSDLMEGIADPEAVTKESREEMTFGGVGVHRQAYEDVQRLPLFHALAHHPNVIAVYRHLFQTDVLPHPRNIARLMLPAPYNTPTPPHQDYIHIQGTKNVWTCWFPVGDCPMELGGLSVLQGSNRDGLLPVKAAEGAGALEAHLCNTPYPWATGDYEAGDVITFSSLTVHKSLPNQLENRVRLSCDYRFQPANEAIEEKSLLVHMNLLSWDEIYAGWDDNEDLKHYWKRHDLSFSPWDESIRWQKRQIC